MFQLVVSGEVVKKNRISVTEEKKPDEISDYNSPWKLLTRNRVTDDESSRGYRGIAADRAHAVMQCRGMRWKLLKPTFHPRTGSLLIFTSARSTCQICGCGTGVFSQRFERLEQLITRSDRVQTHLADIILRSPGSSHYPPDGIFRRCRCGTSLRRATYPICSIRSTRGNSRSAGFANATAMSSEMSKS